MQRISSGDTDHNAPAPTSRTRPIIAAGVAATTTSPRQTRRASQPPATSPDPEPDRGAAQLDRLVRPGRRQAGHHSPASASASHAPTEATPA